jgi:hypothetical protein
VRGLQPVIVYERAGRFYRDYDRHFEHRKDDRSRRNDRQYHDWND